MRFMLAGIPVTIQPWILVTAFLIGPQHRPVQMVFWVVLVVAGVLVHELGHALLARRLGHAPAIELHMMGGSTMWRSQRPMSPGQRVAVAAAGPAVGIAVGLALWAVRLALAPLPGSLEWWVLRDAVFVTLGWGILNLAPILPLDGGTIVTAGAEAVAGRRGRLVMLWISVGLCGALVVWGVLSGGWWLAIIGGVLAFANIQALQAMRAQAPPPTWPA